MLAADHTSLYTEQIHYETEWTEDIPRGISWLNLLTAQPIPEETDIVESPQSPERHHSESSCSSASVESCYVVLEIQRPRSGDEASSKIDDEIEQTKEVERIEEEVLVEEDEEEEEVIEEVEELNFAQTNHDIHHDQLAISMTTEIPMEDYVVEHQQEEVVPVDNYAQVTETVIFETPNDILFQKAKTLSRFTKRMKAMSYLANKERQLSTSSDDNEESVKPVKHKSTRKVQEYHPTAILAAEANTQSCSPVRSTTSLDSIENKTPPSDQVQRVTTTFSNLSTKRVSNPVQNPRSGLAMGTTTLTRTFAFDRACMEKYGQITEKKDDAPIEIEIKSLDKTEKIESTPTDRLNCRSFTNQIQTPFYIGSDRSTIDGSEIDHPISTYPSIAKTNSHSKASSILSSMRKYAQTLKNEYSVSNHNSSFNEPTLLQVKYLDGRLLLRDDQARESFRQNQTISGSFANQLNRLQPTKMCSTQDLSQTTFHMSYRKRMLNRFRAFVENNSVDFPTPLSSSQTRPWQHKTVAELFNERKAKPTR